MLKSKKKKKKKFFLTIQYFRKSLKPVATAKRLIFYYLSEVQHESPAAQQSKSFGPQQLADLTSTRGAPAASDKMLSGGEKALGVVNRSLSSSRSQTKGAVRSPEEHTPWGPWGPVLTPSPDGHLLGRHKCKEGFRQQVWGEGEYIQSLSPSPQLKVPPSRFPGTGRC